MLLLYLGENLCFDQAKFLSSLESIEGAHEVREAVPIGSVCCFRFSYEEDFVLIRLAADLKVITIHGEGPAAQEFVIRFRDQFSENFHLIDEGYSFDDVVTEDTTSREIQAWLALQDPR